MSHPPVQPTTSSRSLPERTPVATPKKPITTPGPPSLKKPLTAPRDVPSPKHTPSTQTVPTTDYDDWETEKVGAILAVTLNVCDVWAS
jgi:hypothetical protein